MVKIGNMKKRLVTSALPYVNNIPHLGNIIQVLSADAFARYCRLAGYETMYICGTDEYGTATETKASIEGCSPRELCDRFHAIHEETYKWFNIAFDYFGRTSTPRQTEIVQSIFKAVDEAGYITEKVISQLYCPKCQRFLADRYVEGTCPKCGHEGARGDQCDNCQSLLEPTELIDPYCPVCHSKPELRETKHLFLDLPKALPLLEKWIEEASERGFWAKNAVQVTRSWIRDGLQERCITRDLKWGIPVPKPGFEDKVFYVWFDAPIGYISITANHTEDYKRWWQSPGDTELFQFIGKDNIPFHTVIFPSTLLATGWKWTMLHHMSSTEYLNYEGGKFSKSRGVGIFGNDVQATGIPADVWRFYIFYNRPEKADVNFAWSDFLDKVNGELIGNLGNLVNRTITFITKLFPEGLGEGQWDEELISGAKAIEAEYIQQMERADERDAMHSVFALSDIGNKAFQAAEPWRLVKTEPEKAKVLLRTLLLVIRDLGVMSMPFMPQSAEKMLSMTKSEGAGIKALGTKEGIGQCTEPVMLFSKLDPDYIESLKVRFSGSQAQREEKIMEEETKKAAEAAEALSVAEDFASRVILCVSKIVEIQRHPAGDMLYILQLDTGETERRQIVSSIVPYYKEEELLGHNIVLVSNLKPANFRSVKSRGMLLAASDPNAEPHTTCEVLFADDLPVGSKLVPEGLSNPETPVCYVKADKFFSMPIETKDGYVTVDGRRICCGESYLKARKYLNGPVG